MSYLMQVYRYVVIFIFILLITIILGYISQHVNR